MSEDWFADVVKYAPDADQDAVAGIVRYCGIALRNRDSALVAFSSDTERNRVRDNFLKKKLALPDPDATLKSAIDSVAERMKGDRTKNRVTVYYLLADHFGKLDTFRKGTTAGSKSTISGSATAPSDSPGSAAATHPESTPPPAESVAADAAAAPVATGAPERSSDAPSSIAGKPAASEPVPADGSEGQVRPIRALPDSDAPETRSRPGSSWWLWLLLVVILIIVIALYWRSR